MSTKPKSRPKKKATKRRDQDPVRVSTGGVVSYWTGGKPGVGRRKQERAQEIRAWLARTNDIGRGADVTLDQLMQDMVDKMREAHAPTGTISQYRSDWNKWVPAEIGKVRCLETDLPTWSEIFHNVNKNQAFEQTVRNVARTLGVLIEYGVENGYFNVSEPLGEPRDRRRIVRKSKKRAAIFKAEGENRIEPYVCPTMAEIEKYAAAFEAHYPGYGRRLVEAGLATGMRLNELLALEVETIHLGTGKIDVDWQLDRSQHWPARKLPKNNKPRTTIFWSHYRATFESLVKDAQARQGEAHGWLFPPMPGIRAWADHVSHLATDAKRGLRLGLDLPLVAARIRVFSAWRPKSSVATCWTHGPCSAGSATHASAPRPTCMSHSSRTMRTSRASRRRVRLGEGVTGLPRLVAPRSKSTEQRPAPAEGRGGTRLVIGSHLQRDR